ncbi:AAA family ATPase [Chengkuizengella marina]|uniref:AAA family ATPase n=1 Tax=Chengkuizengella marina TaxID=2507566 RepID=A0A6N9Q7U0_9BACL|nr:AAA family ATPase [Chengkuizengella marina]NBI30937.1 AAA family ATPase [Chengkuizengella marina]
MDGNVLSNERTIVTKNTRQINVVFKHVERQHIVSSEKSKLQLNGKAIPLEKNEKLSEIISELEQMIGLEKIKDLVYEIYALLQVTKMREEAGLQSNKHVYHMIFKGNPGTGKTTVARIIAKMFHALDVCSKGQLVEVERADLVGEYIGHTANKTRNLIKKSVGGILFVDEAYSLARGGEKDFGKEAIDTLVKAMEDLKHDFILILAGYSNEMDDFLKINPGLSSRFPIQVEFPDYSIDQLVKISELMMKEREYTFLPQTLMKLRNHLSYEKRYNSHQFSNARHVRNQIEKAIRHQAVRLLNEVKSPSKQDLMNMQPEDFKFETHSNLEKNV